MMTVAQIIEALGGSAAVSRARGIPLTTIESWKRANFVPVWRRGDLLELSAKLKAKIRAGDFPEREPAEAAA